MRYILLIAISYLYIFADAHIFVYHRFGDNGYKSTNTTTKELRKEFDYFKNNNYKVVKLEEIISKIEKKEKVPDNWVALTIDDAYKSFYQNGLEIFKEYNYPFTLFIYVEATNSKYGDFMNWKEVKESSKYGSIGLHSYSHPRLTRLSSQEIIADTKKSYDIFTKNMGFIPKIYAYPYGEYNDKVKKALSGFGFDAILNQSTGSINKYSVLDDINRIALVGKVNIAQKLRYETIDAIWYKPKEFPKDGILREVRAEVDINLKNIKLYITGEGWRDIKVKNGIVSEKLNIYLKNSRTRLILSPDYYRITNKIIIKPKQEKKTYVK